MENDIDFIQKIAKSIRSSRATYNLPNKTKTEAYFVSTDSYIKEKIEKYADVLSVLGYSIVKIQEAPTGCAIITISDKLQVHLLLKVSQ